MAHDAHAHRTMRGCMPRTAPVQPRRCRAGERDRSGLRHDGRSAQRQAPARASGPPLLFLLGRLPHQVHRRSGQVSLAQQNAGRRAGAGRHDLHLPDASGDPAGRARRLPDLRHGARAGTGHRRQRAQSRTRRHDAAVLDRRSRSTLPVFVLEMGAHLVGGHGLLPQPWSNRIQFALATPVVLWAGWPFFVRGWQSLVTRNLNMFTLIAIGTGVAWLYSVVATFAPRLFPAAFRGHDGSVAVYFEAAAVITVLVLLGQVLELRAREATSGAIRALLDLAPKTARRVERRRQRRGDRARRDRGRRPPAGAAGRKGAGRRRGAGGPLDRR